MSELTREHYEIAEKNGIDRERVYKRYWDLGWEIDRAITEPINRKGKHQIPKEVFELAAQNGIDRVRVYHRIVIDKMDHFTAATKPKKNTGRKKKVTE